MPSLERIESLFRLLLPPASREHVLGDLHEKYKSRREFVVAALSVLGYVIFGRIRRTTDFQVFLMETFAVYSSFLATAWWLGRESFLHNDAGFLRLAIPTALIAIGLLLSNAYADPAKEPRGMQRIFETAGSISVAFLGGSFAVPFETLLYGSCTSLVLVSTLRILFPPILRGPSSVALQSRQTPVSWRSTILLAAVFAIVVMLAMYHR
jgi:hypothetical protein